MSTEGQTPDADAALAAARIDRLAHELADAINASEREGRAGLRNTAVEILREDVDTTELPAATVAGSTAPGPFNPFGIGIPLFLMGAVLVFLFPPVGLVLFGLAAVVVAWGVGTTLLARS